MIFSLAKTCLEFQQPKFYHVCAVLSFFRGILHVHYRCTTILDTPWKLTHDNRKTTIRRYTVSPIKSSDFPAIASLLGANNPQLVNLGLQNIFRRDTTRASDATLWPWISQRPEVQGPRRTSPRHRPPKGDRVDVSSNRIILGNPRPFFWC